MGACRVFVSTCALDANMARQVHTLLRTRWWAGLLASATVAVLALAGCTGPPGGSSASGGGASCPATPVKVVVTTNVWASVVDQLSGPCAEVVTIVSSPTGDPHDFEPTAATAATFDAADVAVMNGLGYDSWAQRIVDSLGSSAPQVINLGEVVGLRVGDNPHIWYSPTYVEQSAAAVTKVLESQAPAATANFERQATAFTSALQPYLAAVAGIKQRFAGTAIGATESLFDYMAQACGLNITTPVGFRNAESSGAEPTPQDVQTVRRQLSDGTDLALIYNLQTDGSLPQQLRVIAAANGVPVVEITETLVPAGATFQEWQLAQLNELSNALSRTR